MVEAHNVPLSQPRSQAEPREDNRTRTPIALVQFQLSGIRTAIARIAEEDELEGSTVSVFDETPYLIHPLGEQEPTSDFPFLVNYCYEEHDIPGEGTHLKLVIQGVKYASNEVLGA